MDELKITSKFMRNLLTKAISKLIQKKFGYKVDIQLNDLNVIIVDGKAHLHTDVNLEIDNNEFLKIVKSIGLD